MIRRFIAALLLISALGPARAEYTSLPPLSFLSFLALVTGDVSCTAGGACSVTGGSHVSGVTSSGVCTTSTSTTLDATCGSAFCNAASGDVVVSVPAAAAGNLGWLYELTKTDTTANLCTLRGTIDVQIGTQHMTARMRSRGSSWEVVQ
jgi:hypothetical protein